MKINENYLNLVSNYLFSEINKKVNAYRSANPDKDIIKLGIGDVTLPLAPCVVESMKKASDEMGHKETFHGYGEEQGYAFLRNTLVDYYKKKGIVLKENEIFISDGAKSDIGNILDIFSVDNTVLVPDPVYPVYVDTNIMAGRKIEYIYGNSENGFLPMPPKDINADIIYLCSPNNPTGAVYNHEQLQQWVDYALERNAVILFDSAYEAFVCEDNLPTSIYEIKGAEKCAIEFCSLSKTAGFTGTRCGYTIVPMALERDKTSLNHLWTRRQTTKFNGVSYVVQRGAEAVFTEEGNKQIKESLNYYRKNAEIISQTLTELGIEFYGGKNSPYIWLKCPLGMSSWEFFDFLLEKGNIVGTPGAGFGTSGEGFFRLTAFNTNERTAEAMERFKKLIK